MKTQESKGIRLTPRRADGLIPALDGLVALFVLLALRPLLYPAPDNAGSGGWGWGELAAWSSPWGGIVFAGLLLFAFHRLGHYERRRPFWQEIGDIVGWVLLLAAIDLGTALAAGMPLWGLALCWAVVLLALPAARVIARRRLDAVGLWRRPTIVVGTGENAMLAARTLLAEPSLGLSVVAFAEVRSRAKAGSRSRVAPRARSGLLEVDGVSIPVMPAGRLLSDSHDERNAPHVVIAPDAAELADCIQLFDRLAAAECEVDFIPPLGTLPVTRARISRFLGSDVGAIRLRHRLWAPLSRLYKRAFDLLVGAAVGIAAAPLLGAIALAILILDGRPVLFGQRRIGLHGRPFACLKFRTMVRDAETRLATLLERDAGARAEWECHHKLRNDPRICRIGAWLRRTSLDELPQLWNVLRGDMSLIGPRPIVEEELARYGASAPFYLKTRPGLSGLWQVSGRNDVDYVQRVRMDCHYVRNWTPWWDLALLLATVRVVFTRRGAY